jgi:nicotinamide riboside transporter PnuC
MITNEIAGLVGTALAVAGVVLNNYKNRVCFLLWVISNLIFAVIHTQAGLYSLVLRDGIFTVLAIIGFWQWSR